MRWNFPDSSWHLLGCCRAAEGKSHVSLNCLTRLQPGPCALHRDADFPLGTEICPQCNPPETGTSISCHTVPASALAAASPSTLSYKYQTGINRRHTEPMHPSCKLCSDVLLGHSQAGPDRYVRQTVTQQRNKQRAS